MANQQTTSGKGQQSNRNRANPPPQVGKARKGESGGSETSSRGSVESDESFALISVIYHALQGATTYHKYAEDARRADDEELVEFFEQCRDEENSRALRGKQLLAMQLEQYLEDEEEEAGDEDDEDEDEDEDDEDEEDS